MTLDEFIAALRKRQPELFADGNTLALVRAIVNEAPPEVADEFIDQINTAILRNQGRLG